MAARASEPKAVTGALNTLAVNCGSPLVTTAIGGFLRREVQRVGLEELGHVGGGLGCRS